MALPSPLTAAQIAAVLEAFPWPANIEDAAGAVVARNFQAPSPPFCTDEIHDLSEGWRLRLCKPAAPSNSDELNTLVRGMAHEIRNPLSAILTAIELVRDDPKLGEETAMLLDVVKKEAKRMNRILTEFSSYVKPSQPQPQVFDLAHTARVVIESLRHDEHWRGVSFQDALPSDLMTRADETQIRQVLCRLLQNSSDAMNLTPDGGALRLSGKTGKSADDRDLVTLCIEDSGPGFTMDGLQRAFHPFYSTKPHDTGLGLCVARAIVETAGGRIWIENFSEPLETSAQSSPGGARVCLELPGTPDQA